MLAIYGIFHSIKSQSVDEITHIVAKFTISSNRKSPEPLTQPHQTWISMSKRTKQKP